MSAAPGARAAAPAAQAANAVRSGGLVQRKCACGASKSPLGESCQECQSRALQRKLAVGASDDPLELEADRIAAQVLGRTTEARISAGRPSIRRLSLAASAGHGTATSPPSVERALAGAGAPLERALRQDMEQRFGHDFSRVRIHTGPLAVQSARDVSAHAYTVGPSIVFDSGRFSPQTQEGRRLLAHELTHVVQQSGAEALHPGARSEAGAPRPAAAPSVRRVVQREVNPKRIANKDDVLNKIKEIVDRHGQGQQPAEANLVRLAKLGIGFNPGATKEEKDNAFVYTCHCGWIDMGHFFISAAAAYAIGYQRRRLEVRVGGKPHSIDELLTGGSNKLSTVLDLLLKTVPDVQGQQVLANVNRLLKSGEPRDIALVFGYWMEFVQQIAKLITDPGRSLPDPLKAQLKEVLAEYDRLFKSILSEDLAGTLEGSARSAFTMEDLPSDCYGAAHGQDVWKTVGRCQTRPAADPRAHEDLLLGVWRRLPRERQQDAVRNDGRDDTRLVPHEGWQPRLGQGPRRTGPLRQHQGAPAQQREATVWRGPRGRAVPERDGGCGFPAARGGGGRLRPGANRHADRERPAASVQAEGLFRR